jgi:hypothetical protein
VTRYLVDNSVWARVDHDEAIRAHMDALLASPNDQVVTCPPQALEFCYAARNAAEYATLRATIDALEPLAHPPAQVEALDLQQALWQGRNPMYGRAASSGSTGQVWAMLIANLSC